MNQFFKRVIIILSVLLFMSCEGLMWTGEPRTLDTDTMTVTIVFDDPLWYWMLHESGNHEYCDQLGMYSCE